MRTKKEKQITEWILSNTIIASLISYNDRTIIRKFSKFLEVYRMGMGQFSILMNIHDVEGCSQDDLVVMRGFDKSMIAKSVAGLEKEGLVYRITDQNDHRIRRLYLTGQGKELYPELFRMGLSFDEKIYWNFTEEEKKQLIEYLRRIALNVSEL
jgi:DNA-binding MarR family transcriptional regulator